MSVLVLAVWIEGRKIVFVGFRAVFIVLTEIAGDEGVVWEKIAAKLVFVVESVEISIKVEKVVVVDIPVLVVAEKEDFMVIEVPIMVVEVVVILTVAVGEDLGIVEVPLLVVEKLAVIAVVTRGIFAVANVFLLIVVVAMGSVLGFIEGVTLMVLVNIMVLVDMTILVE